MFYLSWNGYWGWLFFCSDGIFHIMTEQFYITYFDSQHWTIEGAEMFSELLFDKCQDIITLFQALNGNRFHSTQIER